MIELNAEAKELYENKLKRFEYDTVNYERFKDYIESVKNVERVIEFCKRENDDIRKFLSQRESRLTKKDRDEEKAKIEKYDIFSMFAKVKVKEINDLDKFAERLQKQTKLMLNDIEEEKKNREEQKKKEEQKELIEALKKVEELKTKFNLTDEQIEKLKSEAEAKK